jgi:alkyl hydroperoxide reductase subunit F
MDIGGQAIDSIKIKNYMGFDFISGKDLINKFKEQFLHEHYLDHKIDEVISINKKGEFFEVFTKSGGKYSAQSIIIASGMKRRKLNVPGEDRLQRRGIFYSSAHDITFCKGSNVVVVGGGNSGVQTANNLKNIGCHVTLVSKGKLIADKHDIEELQGCKDVEILEGYNVSKISGKDKLEGVSLISQDGSSKIEKKAVGVFIQIGFLPNTELCEDILKLNKRGEIIIKPDCSTNVRGIFACGDVTDAFGKRIIVAAGEGAKAALSAKQYLIESGRECK